MWRVRSFGLPSFGLLVLLVACRGGTRDAELPSPSGTSAPTDAPMTRADDGQVDETASVELPAPQIPELALETCRYLERQRQALLDRVVPEADQRQGLPEGLDRCVQGSLGAWVLSAQELEHWACGDTWCFEVGLVVSVVDDAGEMMRVAAMDFEIVAGSASLEQGAVDFDADGEEDFYAIVFDERSGVPKASGAWTRPDTVQRLPGLPPWPFHAVARVDDDALPDLLTYGPFGG